MGIILPIVLIICKIITPIYFAYLLKFNGMLIKMYKSDLCDHLSISLIFLRRLAVGIK